MENKEEEVLRGLNTMLPPQLHNELTDYCKQNADSFGKWSYAIGFRDLLKASKVLAALCELEIRVTNIEALLDSKDEPAQETKKAGVKVFGDEGDLHA